MPLKKLKKLIVPQDEIFFELMQKQAETAHASSQALSELFGDYKNLEKNGANLQRKTVCSSPAHFN